MKKNKMIIFVCLICFGYSFLLSGCVDLNSENTSGPEKPSSGFFDGNVYVNKYFNLTMELPSQWTLISADGIERQVAIEELVEWTMDINDYEADMDLAVDYVNEMIITNFSVDKYSESTDEDKLCFLIFNINNADLMGIETVEDYRDFMIESMARQHGLEFNTLPSESLGGKTFETIGVGTTFGIRTYILFIEEYAIGITLWYDSIESYNELYEIVQSIRFY